MIYRNDSLTLNLMFFSHAVRAKQLLLHGDELIMSRSQQSYKSGLRRGELVFFINKNTLNKANS